MGWITKFHGVPAYIDNERRTPVWKIVAWCVDVDFNAERWRQRHPYSVLPFGWDEIADALAYFKENKQEITDDIFIGLTPMLTRSAVNEEMAYG